MFPAFTHMQTRSGPVSLTSLVGSSRGKSKPMLHCMFAYVLLSVKLVAIQLWAVRLREARLFKDHYEPCQQATHSRHTQGPERMNKWSRMFGFITLGQPGGFGDEQDSMNDIQSRPCQPLVPSLCLSWCLVEDSTSQLSCLSDSLSTPVPAIPLFLSCQF